MINASSDERDEAMKPDEGGRNAIIPMRCGSAVTVTGNHSNVTNGDRWSSYIGVAWRGEWH